MPIVPSSEAQPEKLRGEPAERRTGSRIRMHLSDNPMGNKLPSRPLNGHGWLVSRLMLRCPSGNPRQLNVRVDEQASKVYDHVLFKPIRMACDL